MRGAAEIGPRGVSVQRADLRFEIVKLITAKRKDFHVCVPVDAWFGGVVFFEHAMKIGAAESESADTRTARVACERQPWPF